MSNNNEVPQPQEEEDIEMLKELERLKKITDQLWYTAKKNNWETLSHTETGVLRYEMKKRSNDIQNTFSSMISPDKSSIPQKKQLVKKQNYKNFMAL